MKNFFKIFNTQINEIIMKYYEQMNNNNNNNNYQHRTTPLDQSYQSENR